MSKILLWDLETSHLKADFGVLLAAGYKWLGEKKPTVLSIASYPEFKRDRTSDKGLVRDFLKVYASADMTVTYFGSGFDRPYLLAKALEHGFEVPPNIPMCDLFYTVKANMALSRKSLQNVGYFLGLATEKTMVEGKVWRRAATGHAPSIKYIVEHCSADVDILEEAYLKLRPLIRTHPRVNGNGPCRFCGAEKVQKRGLQVTALKAKQRLQCGACGAWDTSPLPRSAA